MSLIGVRGPKGNVLAWLNSTSNIRIVLAIVNVTRFHQGPAHSVVLILVGYCSLTRPYANILRLGGFA